MKTKLTLKKIALILLFSSILHAQAEPLTTWLKSHIKISTKEFFSYHWANRGYKNRTHNLDFHFGIDEAISIPRSKGELKNSDDTPVELSPIEIVQYFKALSSGFERPSSWSVGGGLYTATDPLQSSEWAGDPWILIRLSAPAHLKYLDLYENQNWRLSKRTFRSHSYSYCPKENEAFSFINPSIINRGLRYEAFVTEGSPYPHAFLSYLNLLSLISIADKNNDQKQKALNRFAHLFTSEQIEQARSPSRQAETIQQFQSESFDCKN